MPTTSEPVMVLRDEIDFFNSHLEEWLQHYEGKFALVKNQQLIGTFTQDTEAYKEGVSRFGNAPFLIKRISRMEKIEKLPALALGIIRAYS